MGLCARSLTHRETGRGSLLGPASISLSLLRCSDYLMEKGVGNQGIDAVRPDCIPKQGRHGLYVIVFTHVNTAIFVHRCLIQFYLTLYAAAAEQQTMRHFLPRCIR